MEREKISLFKVFMSKDVKPLVCETLDSGWVTQGPRVAKFENELCKYFNAEHVVTTNSATAGLTLAYRLLKNPVGDWPGIQEGDICLTPALTCFATTSAIIAQGLQIQWCDADHETANICLEDVERKLNEKTKVICVVHWGGNPVDLDRLDEILENHKKKYGFKPKVVEDCAHAFGAEYKGKKVGTHGNIAVFSFQAIKHLTTCDGGMMILPNAELLRRAKLLRWYGIDRERKSYNKKDHRLENDIAESGYKFHMNDLNAAIGLGNLPHIDGLLQKNRINVQYMTENLSGIDGFDIMKQHPEAKTAGWLFTVRVADKEKFVEFMTEKKIMASQVHHRNDGHSCVAEFKTTLPKLDKLEKELLCLPVGWWLSDDDKLHIVDSVKEFFNAEIHG